MILIILMAFDTWAIYTEVNTKKHKPGPVFTDILILRIFLLESFLEVIFLRMILRIRVFKIWNVLKSQQFCPI